MVSNGRPHEEHKRQYGELRAHVALLTVSSSKTPAADASGRSARDLLAAAGHTVADYRVVRDDRRAIAAAVRGWVQKVDVVVVTGGTGVTRDDVTVEAVRPLFEKELPGFGEMFRSLSTRRLGSAAFLSRATAGVVKSTAIFCVPGSPDGVRVALKRILLPELPHLVGLLRREVSRP
ncbi:MAG: MogA/MoaB family molybdenum cofactor biosynthesis protein [Halobacteria archaeon]